MLNDDRIDIPVNKKLKAQYKKFVEKFYGIGLAAWVRMLMQNDVREKAERK